jgi:hypothetical protein
VFEKSPNRGQWKAQAPPRTAAGSRGPSVRLIEIQMPLDCWNECEVSITMMERSFTRASPRSAALVSISITVA